MAQGQRSSTFSTSILASDPGPGPGLPKSPEERREVRESSSHPRSAPTHERSLPAGRHHLSCEAGPEDMEDTCSEYDNMGSDVEQDCDQDSRFFRPFCPDDQNNISEAQNLNQSSAGPEPGQNTDQCDGSQPETKTHRTAPRFRSLLSTGSGQENQFFFSDGEEVEVLDGVRFIEDVEETPSRSFRVEAVGGPKKMVQDVTRAEDQVKRISQVDNKKPDPSFNGAREKERPSRARGRRVAGQDVQPATSGPKVSSNRGGRPKMPKEQKRTSLRTRAKHLQAAEPGTTREPMKTHKNHRAESPHGPDHQDQQDHQRAPQDEMSPEKVQQKPRVSSEDTRQPSDTCQSRHVHLQQTDTSRTEDLQEEQVMADKLGPSVMLEEPDPTRRSEPPELSQHHDSEVAAKSQDAASFPSFEDVPGPCEPEDLIDGIIFAANYLGCTQVLSDKNPSKTVRMTQAHEAVNQIKGQDEDSQMVTEVDLFISTKAVKVLNADSQETMMDSALRTISYIADIGSIVVLMARRRMTSSQDPCDSPDSPGEGGQSHMICYVFESEDAQLIAQSIGQAFSVAYREFLRANGINPTDLSQKQFSDIINSQEMYHDDLVHFSNSDNCKELHLEKTKGENLGVVIVESGWGSILPTVILACMLNTGPAARSGKLSVGDQIMSINDTSLVGLPLATCQSIIKGLKNQVKIKLSIVSCPPVTTVLIKRPDLKFQLGFSVQNGIICSLMRGGIAERGGVRVGHRIIEINGQSVVAMKHEKIVQTLSVSVGEINMKTMPAVMFRLLTGQETPAYI